MKLIILMITLSFLCACPAHMPLFGGKFYQGDSEQAAIVRNNPPEPVEVILATDPQINQFTCTRTQDLINYLAEVQKALSNCKRWK